MFKNHLHTQHLLSNILRNKQDTKWWLKHLLISYFVTFFLLVSEAHNGNQYVLLVVLRVSRLTVKFMTKILSMLWFPYHDFWELNSSWGTDFISTSLVDSL